MSLRLVVTATSKKQQQARLRVVLAHCSVPTLQISISSSHLRAQAVAVQVHVLSEKLTPTGPQRLRQVRRCPPQSAQFPRSVVNSHSSLKTEPEQNGKTK